MKTISKLAVGLTLATLACHGYAANTCKETAFRLGSNSSAVPTKAETRDAERAYQQTQDLLLSGIKAQDTGQQRCMKSITQLRPEGGGLASMTRGLNRDFYQISVAAVYVSSCLTCNSETVASCDAGLEDLKKAKSYMDCLHDTYYHDKS